MANDWSPDSRFILFHAPDPKTANDLWVLPLDGDRKPFVFLKTNFDERRGQFSPDGKWVAFQSDEAGRDEIYVRPFPAAEGEWQVSTGGGTWARWRADGKELYYIAPDGKLMTASITSSRGTFEAATPVALFQTRIVNSVFTSQEYAVARDGRFLINTATENAVSSTIKLILNWKPPVK
jgi:Tol biopolymer transport system component